MYVITFIYPYLLTIFMASIKSYIKLLRPFTMLAPFISGLMFSYMALHYYKLSLFDYIIPIISGCFALALSNATSNVINQVWDIEEDRANQVKCKRPVASGEITEREALSLAFFGMLLLMFLCSFVNITFTLLMCLIMLFVFIYSVPPIRAKKRLWLNNIVISIPRGLIGVLASISIVGDPFKFEFICMGIIVSLYTFAVNPTKDISDIEGDRKAGIRNLCTVYGIKKAMYISATFLIITYVVLICFVLFGVFRHGLLLVLLLLPVGLIMLYLMIYNPQKKFKGENSALWYLFYIQMIIMFISFVCLYIN